MICKGKKAAPAKSASGKKLPPWLQPKGGKAAPKKGK